MISKEKEKEILQILKEQKNDKLFSEVTGYISRLDSYIYKFEKEIKQLKEKYNQNLESIFLDFKEYLIDKHNSREIIL